MEGIIYSTRDDLFEWGRTMLVEDKTVTKTENGIFNKLFIYLFIISMRTAQ
jgi:hypothetical protein